MTNKTTPQNLDAFETQASYCGKMFSIYLFQIILKIREKRLFLVFCGLISCSKEKTLRSPPESTWPGSLLFKLRGQQSQLLINSAIDPMTLQEKQCLKEGNSIPFKGL